ncbi:negative elongation factor A isoform X2 [Agrilus planipennis]|nr:negative elongation factor A isoform X2 [Agrilus planipennis]
MLAEALKTYPSTGALNTEISDLYEVRPIFTDLVNDLRRLVKKQADQVMLPMECHYVNKAALVSIVGQQPIPAKHFNLKRKPKSALIRQELLQKSTDAASNLKKSSAPVIPVRSRGMPRKMTDTTPLKGIPSRVPTSGFGRTGLSNNTPNRPQLSRTTAGRKEGGVKLLDIADQPLGYAAAKKRKKMQEMEDAKKASENANIHSPPPAAGTTPDYAAGLSATPTYAPATPAPPVTTIVPTPLSTTTTVTQPVIQTVTSTVTAAQVPVTDVVHTTTAAVVASTTTVPALATAQFVTPSTLRPVPPLITTAAAGQRATVVTEQPATAVPVGTPVVLSTRPVQQVTQIRIQPQPTNTLQRRGLALTREQMLEAQDMFRTANKVTRPEKALILGFMAGSRDNPCPHLGNIVTIKLSEDQENVLQSDDTYLTMLVETHFQMNYNNGEWKRIKKYRHIENVQSNQMAQNVPTATIV